jgi:hypothetical protein
MPKNEIADYIRSCVAELAGMARAADLDLLAFLLGMAEVESEALIEHLGTSESTDRHG